MKPRLLAIGLLVVLALAACHGPRREARRMARRAERLFDTRPDSAARLIDSVLRMPVLFSERERMGLALLQGDALFGDHGQEIPPLMDDEYFDDKPFFNISPELERAADYYARKKQYDRAATAALYSGFVQQSYGENKIAMQSLKDAEQYGDMAGDTLAVAMAQYWMGKMLYNDGMEQDALAQFRKSSEGFGQRYTERAKALNSMTCCHLLSGQIDSAELCLNQGLAYAGSDQSGKMTHKLLNNYAVLHRLQGKYNEALENLRMIENEIDSTEMPFLYLNKAVLFVAMRDTDSATLYFDKLKPFLSYPDVKELNKVSAYDALSQFAKITGNDSLALLYREKHEQLVYNVMRKRQEQSIYRIQRQYDYENLQSTMDRNLIRRLYIIVALSLLAVVVLIAFAVSKIRLDKARKQQAEIKANLLHFTHQNEELMQRHDEYKKTHAEMIHKLSEKEKTYQQLLREHEEKFMDAKNQEAEAKANLSSFIQQNKALHEDNEKTIKDLVQKNSEMEKMYEECIKGLSTALRKEGQIMLRLSLFMNNPGEKLYLKDLNKIVFGDYDHWGAIVKVFNTLYPGMMQNLMAQHPELSQLEQKDVVCSFMDVSRQDESVLLGISIHKVDRLRNSVRKKLHDKS